MNERKIYKQKSWTAAISSSRTNARCSNFDFDRVVVVSRSSPLEYSFKKSDSFESVVSFLYPSNNTALVCKGTALNDDDDF